RNQEKIIGLLTALGVVEQELGDYAQAEIHYQKGLAQAQQCGDKAFEAVHSLQRNAFAIHTSSLEWDCKCVSGLSNALKAQISTLLKNLGVLAKKRGNYTQAHTYYQE